MGSESQTKHGLASPLCGSRWKAVFVCRYYAPALNFYMLMFLKVEREDPISLFSLEIFSWNQKVFLIIENTYYKFP